MPQVLFTKRHGAYWPGANPVLGDDVAGPLLADGTAVPYTEETRKKLAQMAADEAGGIQMADGNTPGQPVIVRSSEPVPTEHEPKLRGTARPLKVIGKTEADEADDASMAEAEAGTHPLDELGLDTRVANALTAADLTDIAAVQKYADENEDFTGIEGVGEASNHQILAALKKRARKSE